MKSKSVRFVGLARGVFGSAIPKESTATPNAKSPTIFSGLPDILRVAQSNEDSSLFLKIKLYSLRLNCIFPQHGKQASAPLHSTVTLLAKFLGLSTSVPRAHAV